MKSLLVHGCYDRPTFQTLRSLGVTEFAFDLRARSSNLIPFSELRNLLPLIGVSTPVLIFENDLPTTISSFLDLLKDHPVAPLLEMRDRLPSTFYHSLHHPFLWMFHPEGEWREILRLPNCRGVLLPLKHQAHYATLPELWDLLDRNQLRIFLHAETLSEMQQLKSKSEVELSLDLTSEIELSFRRVDQERLKSIALLKEA